MEKVVDQEVVVGGAGPSGLALAIELGPRGVRCPPVGRNDLYAEHGQWVPQYKLDQVMREHAETLPSLTLRFSTELVSASPDPDGARSRLRDPIGATMRGTYGLSRNVRRANDDAERRGIAAGFVPAGATPGSTQFAEAGAYVE